MPVDRVVAAALEMVDEVGPGEFSMRLLAKQLRSSTATLYRHFASKDEILVHVVDHVLGEIPRHLPYLAATARWQERLAAGAEALFRTLKEHPKVAPLFADHIPLSPRGLAGREAAISSLLAGGFAPEVAARAYTVVGRYVIGFAGQLRDSSTTGPEEDQEIQDFYRSLDPGHYPATLSAAEFLPSSLDDEFRFGLNLIIDGLSRHLPECAEQSPGH
jgi:AcrR family transcriptional regulator